jgi:hypothetical protein
VPYGRLLSEIFHQGGVIAALSATRFYTNKMLDTVVGKVINGRTLKSMNLIQEFTPLESDINESMVVSKLNADFPLICKKDSLAVQMALLSDHFSTTGEFIGLEEVPEEMPGSKLPVEGSRNSKRKKMSEEEYLEVENSSKKKKTSDKLKIGGSGLPSIEKEVQDLDTNVVLKRKTRSGKVAASETIIAPEHPPEPKKKKRKPAIRKIMESPYVIEEVEGVEASTDLVTRELKKKKEEEAVTQALQQALKLSKEIEVPASSLISKDVAAIATKAIQAAKDLQNLVISKAEDLLLIANSAEDIQKDSDDKLA